MKFHSPTIAILALCSVAGAAPISTLGPHSDTPPPVIVHDLGLNRDAVEQTLPKPEESDIEPITVGVDRDGSLNEEELANIDREPGWKPVSEPSSVGTIAVGFAFLGVAAIIRRARTEKRRVRRRSVVRLREIIAAR